MSRYNECAKEKVLDINLRNAELKSALKPINFDRKMLWCSLNCDRDKTF